LSNNIKNKKFIICYIKMIEIEFNYNQHYITVQANWNDKFKDVINKYLQKSLLNPTSIFFLANGKKINPEESVEK